jgi:hypothetical protein
VLGLGAGSGTARACGTGGPGGPGTSLTCGSCPRPTSGPGPRPASGLGRRPVSWAGAASDLRSGLPLTSTSGPPLGSAAVGASLGLDGPPSFSGASAFVPTSGKRSTGGVTWRSGSRAGSLWVGFSGSVAARGGPFLASRPGTPAEPDGAEGVGGWRSPTEAGGPAGCPALASPSRGAGGAFGPEPSWPDTPATVSAA